jgi:cation diffusion facilitator CzcD-associated flavoprotein CzcO
MAPRIVIVGSGFAGIGLAVTLKRAGIESFSILEKADRLGGTWRDNVYPGAACDVPALLYCFSFDVKTNWSRKWAPQTEILDYLEVCAKKNGILPHIRFGVGVASAAFDAARSVWKIRTTSGEELEADFLVSAVGQLNRPHVPTIPGLESFAGTSFHSARWNQSCELDGKNIAVIGNAASAVQLVPELAKRAKRLYVLQRSANWMLKRFDRAYGPRLHALLARVPFVAFLYRCFLWVIHELRFPVLRKNRLFVWSATQMALAHLEAEIADPALRAALTPDYPIGAKRILISDDYYATLRRDNVRLVIGSPKSITHDAIVTASGESLPVDAIVLATGFETTAFLAPMKLFGKTGTSLDEAWSDGAEAYLGMTVSGWPNFFMMYGPNTNLGHNSIIFMLECQARYIVRCIREAMRRGIKSIDVRKDVMDRYNAELQTELGKTVWADVEQSWYMTKAGRITNNWPHATLTYWWRTRRVDFDAYELLPRTSSDEAREALARAPQALPAPGAEVADAPALARAVARDERLGE